MMIVPEKTIAYYSTVPNEGVEPFDMNIDSFLRPLNINHKRDWFTSNFYRCLPLSIGNMQGFAFRSPYSFSVEWNGGLHINDISIQVYNDAYTDLSKMNHVSVTSEFGHGIFTIHFPLILRTPPGVNLMTIAPPNFPLPGISPMTGVVESDNLNFSFTLNFKIDFPNAKVVINKDYPIMGILPIPRYFCDSFELVNAENFVDKDFLEKEKKDVSKMSKERDGQNYEGKKSKRRYYRGVDINEVSFQDHQLPGRNK